MRCVNAAPVNTCSLATSRSRRVATINDHVARGGSIGRQRGNVPPPQKKLSPPLHVAYQIKHRKNVGHECPQELWIDSGLRYTCTTSSMDWQQEGIAITDGTGKEWEWTWEWEWDEPLEMEGSGIDRGIPAHLHRSTVTEQYYNGTSAFDRHLYTPFRNTINRAACRLKVQI